MTHSSPFPVSNSFLAKFKSATESESISYFQATIRNDEIVELYAHDKSGSLEADFDSMANHATEDEASYFIFRLSGTKNWLLISYVPDKVAVKSKMVIASAKGTLKDQLGHSLFVEEAHATTKQELSYAHYKGTKTAIDSRSNDEINRDNATKQEEDARKDMIQQLETKKRNSGTGGIGGYHSVVIPFSEQARSEISKLKTGTATFVELVIDDKQETINAQPAKTVSNIDVGKEIHSSEPRFYVYQTQKGVQKVNVFVYCCPDKSPPKLRMVYSTAKPSVADEITKLGLVLASKKVEITAGSELAEALKDNLNASPSNVIRAAPASGLPEFGGVAKARSVPTIGGAQHHVYGLMDKSSTAGPKKKIVMPPPGAYN